ncbi:hypothetical protein ACU8KH_05853 [Lachancea thermotolerans]
MPQGPAQRFGASDIGIYESYIYRARHIDACLLESWWAAEKWYYFRLRETYEPDRYDRNIRRTIELSASDRNS